MTIDLQNLRIEGVYQQRQPGFYMFRVKLPGGVISAEQAAVVAHVAETFARGRIHLTTRGSIEFHWLTLEDLAEVKPLVAAAGLTSRGACGGAVRGIVCSIPSGEGFPRLHHLAQRLHQHFTNKPEFEGLPKKFKIGIASSYHEGVHLIQDVGLVPRGGKFDIWVAGGLGREPAPGFLLQAGVQEESLIPLIASIVRVYRHHAPSGKRLKHLVRGIGKEGFLAILGKETGTCISLPLQDDHDQPATMPSHSQLRVPEARVFAGELTAAALLRVSAIAMEHAGGSMVLTRDQNILLSAADCAAAAALEQAGFGVSPEEEVRFRICPGSHECRLGLAPTRDLARELVAEMDEKSRAVDWAISGCPNSCSQPQLAAVGVIAVKLVQEQQDERQPRFDLYRRGGDGFGTRVGTGLTLAALKNAVRALE